MIKQFCDRKSCGVEMSDKERYELTSRKKLATGELIVITNTYDICPPCKKEFDKWIGDREAVN